VACLEDSDEEVRAAAAEALQGLAPHAGPGQAQAVEAAAGLLDRQHPPFQAAGITALGLFGDELAGQYVERIAGMLGHSPPAEKAPRPAKKEVQVPYSDFDYFMLAVFGPPKPLKPAKVIQEEPPEQPPAPPPRPALSAVLRKPSCAAAMALARLGKTGRNYAGHVARLTASEDAEVRAACMEALGEMGEKGETLMGYVVKGLQDPDPGVGLTALAVLGQMGQRGMLVEEAHVRTVAGALKRGEPELRCAAALALGHIGGPAASVNSSGVARMLRSGSEEEAATAAKALGMLAAKGGVILSLSVVGLDYAFMRSIKPLLADFTGCIEEEIASAAKGAKVHVEVTRGGSSSASVQAALTPASGASAFALQASINTADLEASLAKRVNAVDDIARVFTSGQPARVEDVSVACQATTHAAAVAALLQDDRTVVRHEAVVALGPMGGGAGGEFAGETAGLLQDPECAVRASAAVALGDMGKAGAAHATAIAELLGDALPAVRRAACEALGKLKAGGEQLPAAVSTRLQGAASGDDFGEVREAATQALK